MIYKSANDLPSGEECTTDTLPVGTCASTGVCAVTKELCRTAEDFKAPRPFGKCNAEGYFQNAGFVPTLYGGCKNRVSGDIVCVLTPEDCLAEEEDWVSASDVTIYQTDSCRCNDVTVGFCASGNVLTSFCAISKDDCNPFTQTFNSARSDKMRMKECRLCPAMGSSEQNKGTTTPPNGPKTNIQGDIDSIQGNIDMINKKEAGALHAGEIVGIVLGGLMTAFIAIIGIFIWHSNAAVEEYLHLEKKVDVPEIS